MECLNYNDDLDSRYRASILSDDLPKPLLNHLFPVVVRHGEG